MAWEALRLTSKAPSEVFGVLGPHGVEELLCKARDCCWRTVPQEQRTVAAVRQMLQDVFDRNLRVWNAIKKPSPEAFFQDLQPNEADHFVRQALVTCWMMLPRAGGRDFKDVSKIVLSIHQRILDGWSSDNATFTGLKVKKSKPPKKSKKQPARKKK